MIDLALVFVWVFVWLVALILTGRCVARHVRPKLRADPRKIHALEYELGMRDDAPPMVNVPPTDAPGQILRYNPPRGGTRSIATLAGMVKEARELDRAHANATAQTQAKLNAYRPPPRDPVGPTFASQAAYDHYAAEVRRRREGHEHAHVIPPPLPHKLEATHGNRHRTTEPQAQAPALGPDRLGRGVDAP